MTLISMTAVAMTRERERGTLENLLAMPARPVEVMLGKISPFIIIAYLQTFVILFIARILFGLPIEGSPLLLVAGVEHLYRRQSRHRLHDLDFRHQSTAGDADDVLLFSCLRCCCRAFCFRSAACRCWAQTLGSRVSHDARLADHSRHRAEGHRLRRVSGPDIWPMLIFIVFIGFVAMKRYRETLD